MEANMPKTEAVTVNLRQIKVVPVDFAPITYEHALQSDVLQDQQMYAFVLLADVEQAVSDVQSILDNIALKAPLTSTLFVHVHYLINQEPAHDDDYIQCVNEELCIPNPGKVVKMFVHKNKCLKFDDDLYYKPMFQSQCESARLAEDNMINIFLASRDVNNQLPLYETFQNHLYEHIHTNGIKLRLEVSRTHFPKDSRFDSAHISNR